jgi:hypothetical protein
MIILKALSLGPLHGDGIGQRIMQMSEDALRVEEGSLYPALYRIERQGWITAERGCRRTICAPSSTRIRAATDSSRSRRKIGSGSPGPSLKSCKLLEGSETICSG